MATAAIMTRPILSTGCTWTRSASLLTAHASRRITTTTTSFLLNRPRPNQWTQKAYASNTVSAGRASSTAPAVSSQTRSLANEGMDWNTYFAFRRNRRNYERVFMAPCALLGLFGAGYYFAQKDFDPTPIFGMDQVLVYGLGTIMAGILGLATGPVVGNMVWRMAHSKARPLVDRMDKEFYKHIVKNRADPSSNSVRNPIPDYYGEKIKSVTEYRSWLRKQREYRRKSTFYVGVD